MSDTTEDLTQESENDSDLVKRLRAEIKQRDGIISEKASELTTVQKENAFRAAGIDPGAGTGKLLFKAYDGEFDKDSVLTAAQEYGITTGEATSQEESQDDEQEQQRQAEAQANQEIDAAATGSPAGGTPTDPEALARQAYDQTMATTGNGELASAAHFDAKLKAAIQGAKSK